jgi:hypothetical protein
MLAYTPNPQLEKLVENFRGTYRGGDITVTSLELTIFPTTDSLKWKNPSSTTLIVEILDVMGEKVFEADTKHSGIKIPSLKKGLFYWKLMNQDFDLHYVGKIRVE